VERNINQLKHVKQSGLIFVRPEPALQVILGAKNFHCNHRKFLLHSQKIFIAMPDLRFRNLIFTA